MLPFSRIMGVYERFSVLSTAAIRQEVQMLVGTSTGATPPPVLRAVCELLLKSGDWSRALVVADALPQAQRQSLTAALDFANTPVSLHDVINLEEKENIDDSLETEFSKMSSDALLKLGFALQRPHKHQQRTLINVAEKTSKELAEEKRRKKNSGDWAVRNAVMQRQLFLEFRRRRQYKELMQCVMNWRSKGLIPARRVAKKREERGIRQSHNVEDGDNGERHQSSTADTTSFNAEEALRELLFNSVQEGSQWVEALNECPEFFVSTLREPAAALQFLRKTDIQVLVRFTLSLLRGCEGVFLSPAMATMGARQGHRYVMWETIASLCFAMRPHLAQEKKTVKTDLLCAVLQALRSEAGSGACVDVGASSNDNVIGLQSGLGSTAASTARFYAMRSVVEGLCAFLAHHNEAQARFIGLPLFIEIAVALYDCGAHIPNALAQCIFLCLGNLQRFNCDENPFLGLSTKGLPFSAKNALLPERKLLVAILNSPPSDRWVLALRLLRICNEQHSFIVTAAHLRGLLSGLQSISIVRTWQAALCAAQSLMTEYHIFPDEVSVEKLMLNLHAASWERSFEVLQLYKKNHILPSPLVLRDLHIVAMKHSSWDVVLQVMQRIEETGPQRAGFMNYVYCLRAYGCAGKWEDAARLFKELKNIANASRSGWPAHNEVTVAIAVMGMMEHQHWECVVQFAMLIYSQPEVELTPEGFEMALAAELLALVHIGDVARVASFLNKHAADGACGGSTAAGLRDVVLGAARLNTLRGMEHLNAPIRLVFDIIAAGDAGRWLHSNAEKFGPATRGGAGRRQLYIPPQHARAQHERLAVVLGAFLRRHEPLFSLAAQQAVAEAMTAVGAGPEYLKAALL